MVAQGDHLFDLAHLQRSRLAVVGDPRPWDSSQAITPRVAIPREPVSAWLLALMRL